MIAGVKKHPNKLPECPADWVVDVPKLILNIRHRTQYNCLNFIGAVSRNDIYALNQFNRFLMLKFV